MAIFLLAIPMEKSKTNKNMYNTTIEPDKAAQFQISVSNDLRRNYT
jgi:hypothetical protein